jgi:hypothetical protein
MTITVTPAGRAAIGQTCFIDLGTGEAKIVNADDGIIFAKIRTPLGEWCQAANNLIDKEAYKAIKKAVKQFKKFAKENKLTLQEGYGTKVFRKAKNGQQILDELAKKSRIPFKILSETEEAQISFNNIATQGIPKFISSKENILLWECGSGSVQFGFQKNGKFHALSISYGTVPTLDLAKEIIIHDPCSQQELELLIQKYSRLVEIAIPKEGPFYCHFLEKVNVQENKVIGWGFVECIVKLLDELNLCTVDTELKCRIASQEHFFSLLQLLITEPESTSSIAKKCEIWSCPLIAPVAMLYVQMNHLDIKKIITLTN